MSAVLVCPKCNNFSVYSKDGILKCSSCGFIVHQLRNICPKCKTWIIRNGTCSKCGFTETKH